MIDVAPVEVLASIGALVKTEICDTDALQAMRKRFLGDTPEVETRATVQDLVSYIDAEMLTGWEGRSSITAEIWLSNTFGGLDSLGSDCLKGLRHAALMIGFGVAFWWKTEDEGLFVVITGSTD